LASSLLNYNFKRHLAEKIKNRIPDLNLIFFNVPVPKIISSPPDKLDIRVQIDLARTLIMNVILIKEVQWNS
jgi:hypothetical protein